MMFPKFYIYEFCCILIITPDTVTTKFISTNKVLVSTFVEKFTILKHFYLSIKLHIDNLHNVFNIIKMSFYNPLKISKIILKSIFSNPFGVR